MYGGRDLLLDETTGGVAPGVSDGIDGDVSSFGLFSSSLLPFVLSFRSTVGDAGVSLLSSAAGLVGSVVVFDVSVLGSLPVGSSDCVVVVVDSFPAAAAVAPSSVFDSVSSAMLTKIGNRIPRWFVRNNWTPDLLIKR